MALFFYLFSLSIISGSLAVVFSRSPVHSVLWLIFTFLMSSGLFILLGAEFIAISIAIVYVGAVAVLFIFVVMMIGENITQPKERISNTSRQNRLLGSIISLSLVYLICSIIFKSIDLGYVKPVIDSNSHITNAHKIGQVLYTDYIVSFQLSGLILLAAMISAVVLTLRTREGVKKQDKIKQIERDPNSAVKLKKVKFNEGVSGIKYN